MTRTRSILCASLAGLFLAAPAHAQSGDCITPAEGQAVVKYLLPDIVTRVEATCRPLIGSQTYLSTEAGALSQRLTPIARAQSRVAKRAIEDHLGTTLPDNELLLSLGRQALAEGIAQELDAEICAVTDRMLEQLDPLPAENLANIVALAIETGVRNDPGSDIKICPAL